MTPKEADAIVKSVAKKLDLVATHRLKELTNQATITSGFSREVLRLSVQDVKFLKDCGIEVG